MPPLPKAHGRSCPWISVVLSQVISAGIHKLRSWGQHQSKAAIPHLDSILASKMPTQFQPEPLEITGKKGTIIAAQNAEHNVISNASFFKKLPSNVPVQLFPSDKEDQLTPGTEGTEAIESAVGHHREDEAVKGGSESPPVLRRSARTRRTPEHLKGYLTWIIVGSWAFEGLCGFQQFLN